MSERASNIHLAKVYLQQARLTKHRNWAFVLLDWAAKRRKAAQAKEIVLDIPEFIMNRQMDLFA